MVYIAFILLQFIISGRFSLVLCRNSVWWLDLVNIYNIFIGGTRWRSWLRHHATSRKVTGSILDGVIGIFH